MTTPLQSQTRDLELRQLFSQTLDRDLGLAEDLDGAWFAELEDSRLAIPGAASLADCLHLFAAAPTDAARGIVLGLLHTPLLEAAADEAQPVRQRYLDAIDAQIERAGVTSGEWVASWEDSRLAVPSAADLEECGELAETAPTPLLRGLVLGLFVSSQLLTPASRLH